MTSIKYCVRELGIGKSAAIDWNNFMRDACLHDVGELADIKIGGPGHTVEVDESMFTKRKNHAGGVLPPQWVFGGICRATGEVFFECVEDRSAETLVNAIWNHILPGTTIHSDCWKGYSTKELENTNYKHLTVRRPPPIIGIKCVFPQVNHSKKIVDPQTGCHTQTIERLWGAAKWRNKKHKGTRRTFLNSYFIEFIWRMKVKYHEPWRLRQPDTFDAILDTLRSQYPVH